MTDESGSTRVLDTEIRAHLHQIMNWADSVLKQTYGPLGILQKRDIRAVRDGTQDLLTTLDEHPLRTLSASELAALYHDLYVPLNQIISYSTLFLQYSSSAESYTTAQSYVVRRIYILGTFLLALLDVLVSYARVETGALAPLETKTYDLQELIEGLLEKPLAPQMMPRPQVVARPALPVAQGDRTHMRDALSAALILAYQLGDPVNLWIGRATYHDLAVRIAVPGAADALEDLLVPLSESQQGTADLTLRDTLIRVMVGLIEAAGAFIEIAVDAHDLWFEVRVPSFSLSGQETSQPIQSIMHDLTAIAEGAYGPVTRMQELDLATMREKVSEVLRLQLSMPSPDATREERRRYNHAIRNEFNVIIGFARMMQSDMTGTMTDEQKQHLKQVQSNASEYLKLVETQLGLDAQIR